MREIFKNRGKKDFFRWMISSGCILIMLFSILTIVRASAYSVLVEDDYWHGYDVGVFGGGGGVTLLPLLSIPDICI